MNTENDTEYPTVRFSAMWNDKLAPLIRERCPLEGYRMEFHGNSADMGFFQMSVNQGIDSRLEAIFYKEFQGEHGRLGFIIEPKSLPVLVRRLLESDWEETESGDSAHSLACSICETLNIELI